MGITTLSRFSLTNLQTLISLALSTSEHVVQVSTRNTGKAITKSPFLTVNLLNGNPPGITQREQIDEMTEQITEHRITIIRIQAYGAGAMTILYRLRAWFGSSPGMLALKEIDAASPSIDDPQDISGAVSTGIEERAVMNVTLTYADIYRVEQATIAEVPVNIRTDNPPSQTDFIVTKPE